MELVPCDYCGSAANEAVLRTTAYDLAEPFTAVRCLGCGLMFTNPRPVQSRIGTYYSVSSYYSYQSLESVRDLSYAQRIKQVMFDAYYNADRGVLTTSFARAVLSRVLIVPPREKMGRILDVGCGSGGFLLMMKNCGWETAGVEISAEACNAANRHGLNVHCGQVEDAPLPDASFDVIVLSQSLEHLYSPKSALRAAHRLLKSDGVLIIGVPNCEGIDQRLFRENWHAWDLPRHLYHFTPTSLRQYLETAGFQPTSLRSTILTPLQVTSQELRRKVSGKPVSSALRAVAGDLFKLWCIKPLEMAFSRSARESLGVYMAAYARKAA